MKKEKAYHSRPHISAELQIQPSGGHACGFLFNFSKVTENAIITIKLLNFFHIIDDVAIGPLEIKQTSLLLAA